MNMPAIRVDLAETRDPVAQCPATAEDVIEFNSRSNASSVPGRRQTATPGCLHWRNRV